MAVLFPNFRYEQSFRFYNATPAVADMDNNGKLEVVAGTNKVIYMWETNGDPSRIEWGSARQNSQNTGEYSCPTTVIRSNTSWNSNRNFCGDLEITSGTLTVKLI
jgi:hypothetical protein